MELISYRKLGLEGLWGKDYGVWKVFEIEVDNGMRCFFEKKFLHTVRDTERRVSVIDDMNTRKS